MLTAYSIYMLDSGIFVKNNQHLFKTNGYQYWKFEKKFHIISVLMYLQGYPSVSTV